MDVEFDPAKDAINREKLGLSLGEFTGFDSAPIVVADDRRDYAEERFRAFGRVDGVDGVGRCLVFVVRDGRLRAISFRPAREKELRRYGV